MRKSTVLVTGGSSGIGLAIAREFARHGHGIVLAARDPERLQQASATIAANAGAAAGVCRPVSILPLDLAAADAGERIAAHCTGLPAPVGVLVNSAGAFHSGAVRSLDARDLEAVIRVNVIGLHAATRAVLDGMLARGDGRILNVGSLAGFSPTPSFAAYGASKAFVHAYSQALREELRGTGVTVSLLAPGLVDTGFVTRAGGVTPLTRLAYRLATSPETVAYCAYRGVMAGEATVVPGISARALWYGLQLVPASVRARVVAAATGIDARHEARADPTSTPSTSPSSASPRSTDSAGASS